MPLFHSLTSETIIDGPVWDIYALGENFQVYLYWRFCTKKGDVDRRVSGSI